MITKLLRGREVAQILDVSNAFAYRLMADGHIPTVRLGRSVRVRQEDLEDFIKNNTSNNNLGEIPFPLDHIAKVISRVSSKQI